MDILRSEESFSAEIYYCGEMRIKLLFFPYENTAVKILINGFKRVLKSERKRSLLEHEKVSLVDRLILSFVDG